MILNCNDQSNQVSSVTRTKHNNVMKYRADAIYIEKKTKFPCQIGSGVVCDDNKIGEWHDQSTSLVYAETEIELLGPIWSSMLCDKN